MNSLAETARETSRWLSAETHAFLRGLNPITFAWLFAALGFLYAPLIIANRLQFDDTGRAIYGYLGWHTDGRPMASVLFWLLNLGEPGVSVFVLNQVIAILFLAAAGTILAASFPIKKPLLAAAAAFPLGGNPYFLENMSWTFDSPQMACGVLLAIAGATAFASSSRFARIVLVPVLIVGCLTLYQPTVNIFFVTAAFLVARRWLDSAESRTQIWPMLTQSTAAAIVGLIAYAVILRLTDLGPYIQHHSQLCQLGDGCQAVIRNVGTYWTVVWSDWGLSPLGVATTATILLGLLALFAGGLKAGNVGIGWRLVVLTGVVTAIVLQYGVYLPLADPVWAARAFVSFGAVAALAALSAASLACTTRWRVLTIAVMTSILVMDYAMLVVGHSIAAAASAQKDFETSLVSRIIYDIEQLEPDIKELAIIGKAPSSPVLDNTSRKFPLVRRVVLIALDGDQYFGNILFAVNGLTLKYVRADALRKGIDDGSVEPVLSRRSYCVFVSGATAIVAFRGSSPGC